MKNIFLLILLFIVAINSFSQLKKIMIVGAPSTDANYGWFDTNHVQPIATIINNDPLLEADVYPIDSVLKNPQEGGGFIPKPFNFGDYDGIVITEAMGSSVAGYLVEDWLRDSIGLQIPMVCLKLYGVRYNRPGWKWLNQSADASFTAISSLFDTIQVAEQTTMTLLTQHEIFEDLSVGDEIQLFENARSGAHLQAGDFSTSDSITLVNAITPLASSNQYVAYNETTISPGATELMWAKEAHLTGDGHIWPRAVILGINAYYMNPTSAYKKILANSIHWILDGIVVYEDTTTYCEEHVTLYQPEPKVVYDTSYITFYDTLSNDTLRYNIFDEDVLLTTVKAYNNLNSTKLIIDSGENYAAAGDYQFRLFAPFISNPIYEFKPTQRIIEISYSVFGNAGIFTLGLYSPELDFIDLQIITIN